MSQLSLQVDNCSLFAGLLQVVYMLFTGYLQGYLQGFFTLRDLYLDLSSDSMAFPITRDGPMDKRMDRRTDLI